jgi:GNAT superfamily N-acetyltransferase
MIQKLSCFTYQEFDTDVFGVPFYRLVDARPPRLQEEVAALASNPPCIADAKLPAEDIQSGARLLELGFRKICVQIELKHRLGVSVHPTRSQIRDRVVLPNAIIRAHASQFVFDRFALDIALPSKGHDRLYEKWIRNSLEGSSHLVATFGDNFITFREQAGNIKIDLVSVLQKGQGIGADLIRTVLNCAKERQVREVDVITECENLPAVRLYLSTGFLPARFFSVFHLFNQQQVGNA